MLLGVIHLNQARVDNCRYARGVVIQHRFESPKQWGVIR